MGSYFSDPDTRIFLTLCFLADEGGPNVKVLKMSVIVEGRPDIELDLTGLYLALFHNRNPGMSFLVPSLLWNGVFLFITSLLPTFCGPNVAHCA